MNVKITIWDLPKTEKEAVEFLENKGLIPKTKECENEHTMTLYLYEKHIGGVLEVSCTTM